VLGDEPAEKELALAELVVRQQSFWELYGPYVGSFHPRVFKELQAMARAAGKEPIPDLAPVLEWIGIKGVIDQVGANRLIDVMGSKPIIERLITNKKEREEVLAQVMSQLSAAERAKRRRRLEAEDVSD
jgi:hypothetical protein